MFLSENGPEKRAGEASDSADGPPPPPLHSAGSERVLQPERFTSANAAEAEGVNSGAFELRSDDSAEPTGSGRADHRGAIVGSDRFGFGQRTGSAVAAAAAEGWKAVMGAGKGVHCEGIRGWPGGRRNGGAGGRVPGGGMNGGRKPAGGMGKGGGHWAPGNDCITSGGGNGVRIGGLQQRSKRIRWKSTIVESKLKFYFHMRSLRKCTRLVFLNISSG